MSIRFNNLVLLSFLAALTVIAQAQKAEAAMPPNEKQNGEKLQRGLPPGAISTESGVIVAISDTPNPSPILHEEKGKTDEDNVSQGSIPARGRPHKADPREQPLALGTSIPGAKALEFKLAPDSPEATVPKEPIKEIPVERLPVVVIPRTAPLPLPSLPPEPTPVEIPKTLPTAAPLVVAAPPPVATSAQRLPPPPDVPAVEPQDRPATVDVPTQKPVDLKASPEPAPDNQAVKQEQPAKLVFGEPALAASDDSGLVLGFAPTNQEPSPIDSRTVNRQPSTNRRDTQSSTPDRAEAKEPIAKPAAIASNSLDSSIVALSPLAFPAASTNTEQGASASILKPQQPVESGEATTQSNSEIPKRINPPARLSKPIATKSQNILTGVDVSAWQDAVDFKALKQAGIGFAYLKSSEGKNHKDPNFQDNRKNARDAGIITGAYHYFRPAVPVMAQVDNFMAAVGTVESDDLPPALDLEDKSLWRGYTQQEKTTMVLSWLKEVEKRTGVRPVIYASPSFIESVLGSAPELGTYKLWIAHYTERNEPDVPAPFSDWLIWQHSDRGRLPGIDGKTDLNRYRGDATQLVAQARSQATQIPQLPATQIASQSKSANTDPIISFEISQS